MEVEEVEEVEEKAPRPPKELEEEAFRAQQPEVAAMRERYATLVVKAAEAIAQLSGELIADPVNAVDKIGLKRLNRLEDLRRRLQSELDRLNGLFDAWRATTRSTRVETHQHYVELESIGDLRVRDGHKPNLANADPTVKFAWDELGVIVTIEPAGEFQPVKAEKRHNEVLVRIPRVATIDVYERAADGTAVLRESKPHLVMDGSCKTETVRLRKSMWSKRSAKLGFSELGAMTSYKHETESAAAAAAKTAGELPATVASSLESASKARKQLSALRTAGLEEELSQVKQEAEAKQQELTLSGLAATEAQHERLERLKQKAAIHEQREKAGLIDAPPRGPHRGGDRGPQEAGRTADAPGAVGRTGERRRASLGWLAGPTSWRSRAGSLCP